MAAEQGLAGAQLNLGAMYYEGQGIPQDYIEAHKWHNFAAARASDEETRTKATSNRDLVPSKRPYSAFCGVSCGGQALGLPRHGSLPERAELELVPQRGFLGIFLRQLLTSGGQRFIRANTRCRVGAPPSHGKSSRVGDSPEFGSTRGRVDILPSRGKNIRGGAVTGGGQRIRAIGIRRSQTIQFQWPGGYGIGFDQFFICPEVLARRNSITA